MSAQLGEKIKEFRVSAGLTQQQLADMLCISRQAVSNWENAKTEPDVGMLSKMSEALHKKVESFFATVSGQEAAQYSCMNFIDGLIAGSGGTGFAGAADMPEPGRYEGGITYNGACVRLIPELMQRYGETLRMELPDGLAVTAEYERAEGGVYFLPRIKNNGTSDSGQISGVRSLDILLPEKSVEYYTLHGDNADQNSFMPLYENLGPGDSVLAEPCGGRSSDETGFPFFTLTYGSETVLVAIGWSGQWRYEISVTDAGTRVTAGLPDADFYLHAGEEVRLPSILVLRGADRTRVLRGLKAFIRKKTQAFQPAGKPLPVCMQPFDRYCWGSSAAPVSDFATVAGQKRLVDAMNRCGGFDVLWVDACWFKDANTFPAGVCNFSCAPGFPEGLGPVADYAHQNGYKLMVWFEPERICAGSEVWQEHPDYLLKLDDDFNFILDLSRPEVVDYLLGKLTDTIRNNKIDIYRQDFNARPLAFWNRADEPGRRGITQMHYIDGLYTLWDRLREAFPGIMIDNCASGGRRIDLETAIRSVNMWRSDMGCMDEKTSGRHTSIWKQNVTLSLSRFIPYHCTGAWVPDAYDFRGGSTDGAACAFDVFNPDFDFEAAGAALEELRKLRKYWSGDFYPVTKPTTDESVWCIYRFALEDSGAVYCFRRPESMNPEMLVSIPDAPDGQYRVLLRHEDRSITELSASGQELRAGITVTVPQPRASLIMEYIRQH
ncbi:MAG: alpha-galactosidase [Firmicutes bacterium]|nr:alpha-galactosidase [Bacillota bacterium]